MIQACRPRRDGKVDGKVVAAVAEQYLKAFGLRGFAGGF